jgi:hypothetical protein
MTEALGQKGPQLGLDLGGRSEIDVAALGRTGEVLASAPDQKRLAEARARRQNGDRGVLDSSAVVDEERFIGLQMRHRMCDGLEIVEQRDALDIEALAERRFFQVPGKIGQVRSSAGHRACDVEARRRRLAAVRGQKSADDRLQTTVVGAAELLLRYEFCAARLAAKQVPVVSWSRRCRLQ